MLETITSILKNFAIIPNIHPIFVHFTLALVSFSFIMYILEYLLKNLSSKNSFVIEFDIVARWCLWASMIFVILTVLAGLHAYYTVPHDEDGHMAMQIHKNAAIASFILILLVGGISIWRFKNKKEPSLIFIALLFLTQLSVVTTAYLGAEVVFRYGVGVIKAQTPDMMIGHHHHKSMPDMPSADDDHDH